MYTLKDYKKYFMNVYAPLEFIPVKGHGSHLYGQKSEDMIDFASGIAVTSLGQTNKKLVSALTRQAKTLWHVGNVMTHIPQLELAKKLVKNTCFDKVFLCNSGTEAIEAALKLARKYASTTYGEHKNQIVSFDQSFHGRTLFAVSAGGQTKNWEGFAPLVSGISHGKFNDIKSLKNLINKDTAAVIIELVQAEGGVNVANPEFIQEIRKLCDKFNCSLIFDEVQTGMGRTGKLFAYQHYAVEPDILASAKALGGGFPIGAVLAKEPQANGFTLGSHGCTFGGNPLACAVANVTFAAINQKSLLDGVKKREKLMLTKLNKINQELDIYSEIRGIGLLIGAQLKLQYHGKAQELVKIAAKHGVITLIASPNVSRFLPALNIPIKDLKLGLKCFKNALIEFKKSNEKSTKVAQ